ncbi:1690_t:CDS:2 [Entrophospora sp. SA101]|nr:1690_t:CDS:2 [Entrophospora sp. SA101]
MIINSIRLKKIAIEWRLDTMLKSTESSITNSKTNAKLYAECLEAYIGGYYFDLYEKYGEIEADSRIRNFCIDLIEPAIEPIFKFIVDHIKQSLETEIQNIHATGGEQQKAVEMLQMLPMLLASNSTAHQWKSKKKVKENHLNITQIKQQQVQLIAALILHGYAIWRISGPLIAC